MIIYVTGGVRSGKSRYAQNLALSLSPEPVYIATAQVMEEDFAARVNRHKQERGSQWTTYEVHRELYKLPLHHKTVVIDCVTLWLTGFFMEHRYDIERSLKDFKSEIEQIIKLPGTFIIISNELGMGLHAETVMGRMFTDLQGWANQYVVGAADKAVFMVSGIPLDLKK